MHPNPTPRRRHSDELKAEVLAACNAPGASISGVALAHGLNTNLVRKWRSGRGAKVAGTAVTPAAASKAASAPAPALGVAPEFVAIEMPAPPKAAARATVEPPAPAPMSSADAPIEVELRRGTLHLNVRWPTAAADDCRAWLRELTAGLVK
jgi:transposase